MTGKGITKKLDPLFDMDAEIERLALLFAPILGNEINDAGIEAMILVTPEIMWDNLDPRVSDFLKRRTKKVSTSVNAETDKQLRAELVEGLANGEGIDELRARIERVYGAAAGYRAERIARTETIRAENFASQEAWRQSGVVERKEWFTAEDERVCEFCGPMDGRVIDLSDKFFSKGDTYTGDSGGTLKLNYESIEGAPLHANCRCTLLPVLFDDDAV